jgi:HlyD family secretion protein
MKRRSVTDQTRSTMLLEMLALSCYAVLFAGCTQPAPSSWSGYVEGDYVYVAAPLAGTLTALAVQRGQTLVRGAALFTLDAESERAARDEAAARLASARAQAANTDKGKRTDEIAVTKAQLVQAQSQAALAASELARQQQLLAQGFVSASRLDDARTAAQQTQAHVAELSAALRVAQLPARVDERSAATASTQAAQAALKQTQWREQQKQQSAPVDALVADTFFRVGEWVNAGQPVVALLPAAGTKARFFVPEQELATITLGQPVAISCDGCGAPLAARIDFIATQAEYTPPVIYSNAQRARLVFMVEARPDAKDSPRLKPGQPVDVRRATGVAP